MTKDILRKVKNTFLDKKFVRYAVIGFSGVAIDFVIYALLVKFAHFSPVVASIISVSIAILNNFVWNAFFNFKKKDRILRRFVKFYLTGCIGLALTVVIIFILHDLINLGPLLSKIISIPPVVALQFILNKKFTFTEKSSIGSIKTLFANSVPYITTITFLVLLSAILLVNVFWQVPTNVDLLALQKIHQSIWPWTYVAAVASLIFVYIHANSSGVFKKITVKFSLRLTVVMTAIISLLIICLVQYGNPVSTLQHDIRDMNKSASQLTLDQTDPDGYPYGFSMSEEYTGNKYFLAFPYQLGILSMLTLSYSIFGIHNFLPFQLLVVASIMLLAWSLCKIAHLLFRNDIITKVTALLCVTYLPVLLLSAWIYGDIIALSLGVASLYFVLDYIKLKYRLHQKILSRLVLSIILMSLAIVIKPTMLIFVIGLVVFLLFLWLKRKIDLKLLLFIPLSIFLIQWLIGFGIMSLYGNKLNVTFNNPIPKSAFIAMGLQTNSFYTEDEFNFGRANNYTWAVYEHSKFNTNAANLMATENISDSLTRYYNNPREAAWFFGNKFILYWATPDFSSLQISTHSISASIGKGDISYSEIQRSITPNTNNQYGVIGATLQNFMFAHKIIVILGAIMFCFVYIRNKKKDNLVLLIPLIFIIGIGVYMLWECQPRYMIPFFTILIPLGAYGLYAVCEWLGKIISMPHTRRRMEK